MCHPSLCDMLESSLHIDLGMWTCFGLCTGVMSAKLAESQGAEQIASSKVASLQREQELMQAEMERLRSCQALASPKVCGSFCQM